MLNVFNTLGIEAMCTRLCTKIDRENQTDKPERIQKTGHLTAPQENPIIQFRNTFFNV